jgi:hypothetical protein
MMLWQAQERLLRLNYEVLGGWLVPCNDLGVLADAKKRGIPELAHPFRSTVAELNTSEDRLISVSSWEGSVLDRIPSDIEAAKTLYEAVNSKFGEEFQSTGPIRVYCVCGCDHGESFLKHGFGSSELGVVIVPREGSEEAFFDKPTKLVYVGDPTPGQVASYSSTKLRNAILKGERQYVEAVMHSAAARFILQPSMQDINAMKRDFENLGVVNPAMGVVGDAEPWPLEKLHKNLKEMPAGSRPAVLVLSGSMSPAHHGHLNVIRQARERLQQAGYTVLAGFLSPQNATGSAAEMRAAAGSEQEMALSTTFRLLTTKLTLADDDFLSLATWEAAHISQVATAHEVMTYLAKYIIDKIPSMKESGLCVFYACGPGQAARRGLTRSVGVSNLGIVIVPREDEDCFSLEKPTNLFYVAEPAAGEANIVVAAKIRAALQSGDVAYVSSVVAPSVARLLLSPTEAERADMKADFDYLRPDISGGDLSTDNNGGALRLTEPSAEAQVKLKKVLQAWAGPSGQIAMQDIARLLEVIDPSWTSSELSTLSSGAWCNGGGGGKSGSVDCEAFTDWLFGVRDQ